MAGALSAGNTDFNGLYYSDADGTLNPLGDFISIQASFMSNSSSGLNIDSVRLNFLGGVTEFASVVPSFVNGVAYVSASELNALGATNNAFPPPRIVCASPLDFPRASRSHLPGP